MASATVRTDRRNALLAGLLLALLAIAGLFVGKFPITLEGLLGDRKSVV